MKILIHDLEQSYSDLYQSQVDFVIQASGKYAPCQGCFKCWTKHPASCALKDSLHEMCRVLGKADELVIISENWYGAYSPSIKNVLDRTIGKSTPLSTYRGKQMHHTLRYGKHKSLKVYTYGDITDAEKETWKLMVERNAINDGYENGEVQFVKEVEEIQL